MNLYLDDDSAHGLLVNLLEKEGHDVVVPHQVGRSGKKDADHFMYAIRNAKVLLTHNHEDYELLHELVMLVGGQHPGILVVRRDNNPNRDMNPPEVVKAIRNLVKSGSPIANNSNVLNHWR